MKGFVRHRLQRPAVRSASRADARVPGPAATWWCAGVVVRRLCRQGLYRPSRQSDRPDQGLIPPLACPWCLAPDGASVDRCTGGMDPRSAWPVHARGAWTSEAPGPFMRGGHGSRDALQRRTLHQLKLANQTMSHSPGGLQQGTPALHEAAATRDAPPEWRGVPISGGWEPPGGRRATRSRSCPAPARRRRRSRRMCRSWKPALRPALRTGQPLP